MRAKNHPGSEEHTETSSSNETMKAEKLKREGLDNGSSAGSELKDSGLTAEEIAGQSAYEDDPADVTDQAAEAKKSKAGETR